MSLQELYKVLEDRAYVVLVLYDRNYNKNLEVYQGLADNIPLKYMNFVVCKISAAIIEAPDIAYIIEIC